jgi:hypothetical protein
MSVDISKVISDKFRFKEFVDYAESRKKRLKANDSNLVTKSREMNALMSQASSTINLPDTSIKGSLEGPLTEKMTQIHSKNLSLSNIITQTANNLRD